LEEEYMNIKSKIYINTINTLLKKDTSAIVFCMEIRNSVFCTGNFFLAESVNKQISHSESEREVDNTLVHPSIVGHV
jgi:hypothetical protein